MIHNRFFHARSLAQVLAVLFGMVALGGVAGCTDSDGYDFPPSLDAVIPLDGQIMVPVALDDRPGHFLLVVDTGAFATTVDERLVRDVENGVGVVTLDFGNGVLFEDFQVFAADLSLAENYIGIPIYGLIGQDIVQQMYFGLDYQASEVTAASPIPDLPPPAFVDTPGVDVPYTLEQLMPVVEVNIGGQTARLIADTGSGVTLLTKSFVSQALQDTGFGGYLWHTSYGSDPGTIVRLPTLGLGGHEVADTWAVVVPDDYHLKELLESIGVFVDGFLGYPVYRRFYVAVHGPQSKYRLYPYAELSHIDAYEWDRLGLEVRREDDLVRVDMVFEPSDASAMGVLVDDVLTGVDQEPVTDLPLDEVRLLLRGTPGDVKTLELERAGAPVTLQVAVERMLPPLN